MSSRVDEYVNLPYSVRVVPDRSTEGHLVFLASVEELPGCESHGETAAEARENLRDAMELYIGSLLADGVDPPEPKGQIQAVFWCSLDPPVGPSRDGLRSAVTSSIGLI